MAASARSTRSRTGAATSSTKGTPTKTRASSGKNKNAGSGNEVDKSPYFAKNGTKRKGMGREYQDSDALDDDDDDDNEEVKDDEEDDEEKAPVAKKRSAPTRKQKETKKMENEKKKAEPARKRRKVAKEDSEDGDSDALDDTSATEEDVDDEEEEEEEEEEYEDEDEVIKGRKRGKRSAPAPTKKAKTKQKGSSASPQKTKRRQSTKKTSKDDDDADEDNAEFTIDPEDLEDLEDGQEVVGIVVQAPTTGRVPPGQISRNTLNFLEKLKRPECNDREWFKLHEPVYRLAEKEWKDFIEAFTDVLVDVDPQIPHLPPKDVIHRIYRDVRFSNDKTPYKKGLSASFSRSGRKGIFAHYHIAVKPGNESIIAAGSWCPARNELATIRSNIQRNPRRLRRILSDPDFVRFFGEPKPNPNGGRQSIFGGEDELKVAPKGVAKDDVNIDLLKCRSFAVVHTFTDSEVLSPDFKETLASVARVMQPFVHCLNDMMTIQGGGEDGSGDEEEEEGENGEAEDGEEDEDAED